jgi:transcriptional regulator with XRE-family HTH domain
LSDFGKLLAEARKAQGISQIELASRANLSGGYISQLESGSRGGRIPRFTIDKLAEALNTDKVPLLHAAGYRVQGIDYGSDERMDLEEFIGSEPTLSEQEREALLTLIAVFRSHPKGMSRGRRRGR